MGAVPFLQPRGLLTVSVAVSTVIPSFSSLGLLGTTLRFPFSASHPLQAWTRGCPRLLPKVFLITEPWAQAQPRAFAACHLAWATPPTPKCQWMIHGAGRQRLCAEPRHALDPADLGHLCWDREISQTPADLPVPISGLEPPSIGWYKPNLSPQPQLPLLPSPADCSSSGFLRCPLSPSVFPLPGPGPSLPCIEAAPTRSLHPGRPPYNPSASQQASGLPRVPLQAAATPSYFPFHPVEGCLCLRPLACGFPCLGHPFSPGLLADSITSLHK